MIHWRHVFFLTGILTACMAATMALPVLVDWLSGASEWKMFAFSGTVTFGVALLLILANRPQEPIQLSIKDAFVLVVFSWMMISAVVAVPFYFMMGSWVRAIFESVSAVTTTGATTMEGLDTLSAGVLVWRSLVQWVGGIGVVVMAMTIFPALKIGGMQLFLKSAAEPTAKILPRVSQIAILTCTTYLGLTVLCCICLLMAGMGTLDAVCHSLTTVATGGFSTRDAAIGAYMTPEILLILTVFMILGGSTLLLVARLFRGQIGAYFEDGQIQAFLKLIGGASLVCGFWRYYQDETGALFPLLLESLFMVTSLVTTTGFVTTDFSSWGTVPGVMMFFLTFVGATTGSTAGGIKIFRFQVIWQAAKTYMKRLIHPHGVYIMRCQGMRLEDTVVSGVFSFVALYGLSYIGLVCALAVCDVDVMTGLAAAASALSNVGPVPGGAVFATETHAAFSNGALGCLSAGMLVGRLEFVALLVLCMPSFWRR